MPTPKSVDELTLGGSNAFSIQRSKERAARRAQQQLPPGAPTIPDDLSMEELEAFETAAELMEKSGTLTQADGDTLALYARTKTRWKRESIALENEGTLISVTRIIRNQPVDCTMLNPRAKIVERLKRQLLSLLGALGLSPASRRRVRPVEVKFKGPKPGSCAEEWEKLKEQGY